MAQTTATSEQWKAAYRSRWPRAVVAFEAEERACAAVAEAKALGDPEQVQIAQRDLRAARSAYISACRRDEATWERGKP